MLPRMENTISARIRERLAKLNLSAHRASLDAGLSSDGIRNIQRAERDGKPYDPRSGTLAKLAPVLQTTEEWLMHGRGSQDAPEDRMARARQALSKLGRQMDAAMRATPMFEHEDNVSVPEIDVRAGMGAGGVSVEEWYTDDQGQTQARDAVRAQWGIPGYYLRESRLDPAQTDIIEASGTSNEPEIRAGDRLIVDRRHRVPSPEGFYALWDGLSVIVKALQVVPNSSPKRVRVISVNPLFEPYEVPVEDVHIIGKITHIIKRL